MKVMDSRTRNLALILSVAILIPLAILIPPQVRAATVRLSAAQSCAATGAYTVGNSPVRGGVKTPQIVPPGSPLSGFLSGTLTLSAYTGCGAATSGRFLVHVTSTRGILPGAASSSGAMSSTPDSAIVIPFFNTSIVSATGTFQQDPAHKTDPEYILVSGTVRYGQVGVRCVNVCTNQESTGTTLSTTVTFHDVTGYLRIQAGKPATAGMLFLPPPAAQASSMATMLAPRPVSFWGVKAS